jgi:hypothetical protein
MKARLRTCLAALFCLAGSPALAQQVPTNETAPAQNGVVGPAQLQNFSITGNVTQPATTPPAQQQPQPQPQRSQPAAASQPQTNSAARAERAPSAASEQRQVSEEPATRPLQPSPQPTAEPTQPSTDLSASVPGSQIPAAPVQQPRPSDGFGMLPWILGGVAIAAAAAWFFLRQKSRESFAGVEAVQVGAPSAEVVPEPAPQPRVAAPAPVAPAPVAPRPVGVVSSRLRPWLEIQLNPDRGVVDDEKAAVAFELTVTNSGSVPARDVVLEATLFGAGPAQDQQIQNFFDKPVGRGEPIPAVPPLKSVTVNTAVFLARDQVQPIEVEGRQLFVPMIAVNALYSWGASKGQSSASYLVGKETSGDKLAPFRTDVGRRVFRGLAARQHALTVRK